MKSQLLTSPQPTTKRIADLNGPDFYPTPSWATHVLLDSEKFSGNVWECACGDGEMSDAIASHGYNVESSDLFDRGYGDAGVDFLKSDKTADNIITNPPFHSAEEFVAAAREKATKKYAFLLRLAFLESANRQKTIFLDNPPSKIWVFSERITFYPRGAVRKGSGTTAYAWFVWDQENDGPTELSWLPTGYKSGSKSKPSSGLLL